MLEIRNISKQYPGTKKKANNGISLDLRRAEILCIAGENGAGKTTLMKILCGLEKQDSGEIKITGAHDNKKIDIGMVHQHFMLFPEYTAAENIVMGNEPLKWGIFFDREKAGNISKKIILENNFSVKPDVKVMDMSLGEKQQVEICRILYRNADIIILDEPTSILTEAETQSLFNTLRKLAKSGKSIILITHKLNEIKQISDRVAVLRRGELAGIFDGAAVDVEKISCMMVNDEINPDKVSSFSFSAKNTFLEKSSIKKNSIISFENVTVCRQGQKRPLLDDVSFSVYSGEILGFAGVGGNGLGIIEAVLGGFLHPVSGKVLHRGKDISNLSIGSLRKQGLAYVPADRVNVGSAADATIEENIIINNRNELRLFQNFSFRKSFLGFIGKIGFKEDFSRAFFETKNLMEKFGIEASDLSAKASTLSGGNLQKLILAREINLIRDYFVFSEPTWGLDMASSRFVKEEIKTLGKMGAAIILISANLDEIIEMSDRVIVMYRGKIAGVFNEINASVKNAIANCMQTSDNTQLDRSERKERTQQ